MKMTSEIFTFHRPSAPEPASHRPMEGWLEGQLLVATPQVQGDLFVRSVIYLFAHNEDGAMGLIVNKPLHQIHYSEVLTQLDIAMMPSMRELMVMHGGPVEEQRGFLLHSNDYVSDVSLRFDNGLSVTASANILKDIAQGHGPMQRLLMLGYAGWGAGQLEAEIEQNSWISVPATPALVFGADHEAKWSRAAGVLGIDMSRFSPTAGHA